MKTTKRFISALLAALLTLSLAACNNSDKGVNIPTSQNESDDFQKNMHQSDYYRLDNVCETESGYYIDYAGTFYYVDKETKGITILCARPDCAHDDWDCNAWLSVGTFWTNDNRIYYTNSTLLEEQGKLVDHGERIYAIDLDGTHHTVIQDLEFVPSGSSTHVAPIFHRGYVYFFYSGIMYKMPLGGDLKKSAVVLWGEEIANDDRTVFDSIPVGHNFTLWADGNQVYFMVNVQQPDGTYKDTLFAYDTTGSEAEKAVKQVWQTPDADTVGQWTSTGVAVSKWYIIDGYIYFYLSGGDYWRCDLNTGKYEKLADTHQKTTYGKAIFADGTMCLLNSVPMDMSLPGFEIVGDRYNYNKLVGGDTFYVYGLDGSFVKELPLASLYGECPDIVNVEPVFCANGEIWFVAEQEHATGQTGTAVGGFLPVGGVKTYDYTLCCVNIETGEITQIINWHRD